VSGPEPPAFSSRTACTARIRTMCTFSATTEAGNRYQRSVERDELEGEIEAAGADEVDERLDARGDGALFPAGDDGAIAPGSLRELVLGQAGAQPRLSDQVGASHDAECRART
jgi:hypothetical protein